MISKKTSLVLIAIIGASGFGFASKSQAAPVIDSTSSANSSSAITFDTSGLNLVGAEVFGPSSDYGGSSTITANGLTFNEWNPSGPGATVSVGGGIVATINVTGGGLNNDPLGSVDSESPSAYYVEEYATAGQNDESLSFSGLNPALTYEFQFAHNEPRNITYNTAQMFSVDGGVTATQSLVFGPGGSGDQYALLTVTVSGTSTFSYTTPSDAPDRGPSFAGFSVSTVAEAPEPSTVWLLASGFGLLLITRLRRSVKG